MIWDTVDGFYAQAGCFFGDIESFKLAVVEKYNDQHTYIKAVDFLASEWD